MHQMLAFQSLRDFLLASTTALCTAALALDHGASATSASSIAPTMAKAASTALMANIVNTPLTQGFPIRIPGIGPFDSDGCRRRQLVRICRKDGQKSNGFKSSLLGGGGSFNRIESFQLVEGCARIVVSLGVDHSGSNGLVCLQPVSTAVLNVVFDQPSD